MIAAIGDLAAFEREDRQVGAIPQGTDFHAPKLARRTSIPVMNMTPLVGYLLVAPG
jgi:hypothetical protein